MKRAGSLGGSSATGIAGTGGRSFLVISDFFVRLLFFRETEAADASGMAESYSAGRFDLMMVVVKAHHNASGSSHVGAFPASRPWTSKHLRPHVPYINESAK